MNAAVFYLTAGIATRIVLCETVPDYFGTVPPGFDILAWPLMLGHILLKGSP